MSKIHANRGVPRNKRPLKNMLYTVEVKTAADFKIDADLTYWEQFRYKDLGYLILRWGYQGNDMGLSWHGGIKPADLKEILGAEQWRKFTQGKRDFIIQRRVDGKNIPLEKNKEK